MEKSLAIQIIEAAFQFVLLPLLIWAIKELASVLRTKAKNEKTKKYVDIAEEVVTNAVKTVSQTYVEALKEEGKFDAEAQKKAFAKAFEIVSVQLTAEAKATLDEAFGDVNEYLTAKIEASVRDNKYYY